MCTFRSREQEKNLGKLKNGFFFGGELLLERHQAEGTVPRPVLDPSTLSSLSPSFESTNLNQATVLEIISLQFLPLQDFFSSFFLSLSWGACKGNRGELLDDGQ